MVVVHFLVVITSSSSEFIFMIQDIHDVDWCKKVNINSHYLFQKDMALSWIGPDVYWSNRYYKKKKK